jgi:hypothetical protein
MTYWIRPAIVVACTALMIYTNLFGGGGSGFTEEPNDPGMYYRYPTPISPAPFTFAIWLPIFLGCCVLAIYQALPANAQNARLDSFAWPYCVGLLANASTPFLRIGWSNLVVTILFLSLCIAVVFLSRQPSSGVGETICLRIPTVVFTTWCGIAMVVNLCQWLVSSEIPVSTVTASLIVCLVMCSGWYAVVNTNQVSIAVVMLWAAVGIYFAQPHWNVVCSSILATSVLTALLAIWVRIGNPVLANR